MAQSITGGHKDYEQQYDVNGEVIKKKRGRKPKSYYIQKILDQQRQKEQQ